MAPGDDVVLEVVDVALALVDEVGHDVAAHVVLAALAVVVAGHGVDEDVGVEDVVAHRGQHLVGGVRQALGVLGLLLERRDLAAVVVVDLDDAELVGQRDGLADGGDGDAGTGLDVLGDHLGEVHAVDVVGADDDDDVGLLVV